MSEITFSQPFLDQLRNQPVAWTKFCAMPPSHQREWAKYVMEAKKDTTRQKRFDKMVSELEGI